MAVMALAIIGVTIDASITNHSFYQLDKEIFKSNQGFALTLLIYQSLMSLLIVMSMKDSSAENKGIAQPKLYISL